MFTKLWTMKIPHWGTMRLIRVTINLIIIMIIIIENLKINLLRIAGLSSTLWVCLTTSDDLLITIGCAKYSSSSERFLVQSVWAFLVARLSSPLSSRVSNALRSIFWRFFVLEKRWIHRMMLVMTSFPTFQTGYSYFSKLNEFPNYWKVYRIRFIKLSCCFT